MSRPAHPKKKRKPRKSSSPFSGAAKPRNYKPRSSSTKREYVYAIFWEDVVKIGRTGHPKRRLGNYTLHNPFIEAFSYLVRVNTGESERIEAALHKRYQRFRFKGEWFRLDEPTKERLVEDLEKIRDAQALAQKRRTMLD